jgi:pilus assembly protein TadC
MRFGMAILLFSAMRLVFNFPITVSMAGGFMGILIANSLLDNVWMKLRNTIDQEIPIFLSGITSAVRANQNVLQAVEEVASGLKENSPLKTWLLERFVQISQEQGESSIDEMVEEAFRITNYLGVLIFLIGRLWRIGGMNWWQSFAQAASNLKGLLETKEHGFAAIASAKNAMKVIIFVTMLIVMVMARNPVFSSAMESPLVQAVYALATIMMIVGYGFMDNMIESLM